MRVVGCFLEYNGTFVILLRHERKPDGNTWGLPSGKVEEGESDEAAMLREIKEEIGYTARASQLEHLGYYTFEFQAGPFTYVTYRLVLSDPHTVRLENGAHTAFQWVTPKTCDALPNLIPGFHEVLRFAGYVSPRSINSLFTRGEKS